MRRRYLTAALTVLTLGLSTTAAADDLFVLTDDSDQLPDDPAENGKDTLDVELEDVDSDGDLDIFVVEGSASAAGFQNLLWINDGNGGFSDETALRLPVALSNSTEVDFADIDGDGDRDAIVSNLGPNQLLENDGNGFFSDISGQLPQAVPPGPPGFAVPFPPFFVEVSAEAIFADVDNDGDPDILISNENPFPFGPPGDQNRLLINDGSGNYSDQTFARLPFDIDNTSGFVAGDIDADGDMDLVVANIGQNKVFLNNGVGFFTDDTAARMPALSNSTRKIALGDVDGDGDLDIVAGNSRNQQDTLSLNDGSGVFSDVTLAAMPEDAATNTDIDLADLDGDGDLDIFVTNVGDFVFGHGFLGEPNRIYQNDGQGVFSDITFPRLELRDGRSTNADLGDVDGDGVIDIIVANSGGVDQPGLPPPDGQERLYLRDNCDMDPTFCHQIMVDGLVASTAALDTATFPTGDMTSNNTFVNEIRKTLLEHRAGSAQWALDNHKPLLFGIRLLQINWRSDGQPAPPDWVAGDAANTLSGYSEFSLEVLLSHGL